MTGAVLALCSLGLLGAGGAALRADTAARHGGYADLGSATYATSGHAITSNAIELHVAGSGWDAARSLFGTVRIQATSTVGAPVFTGIAPAGAASGYLAGVQYAAVHGTPGTSGQYTGHAGAGPAVPPARTPIWDARAAGVGTQTLMWPVRSGNWTVVAMNANGSAPVSVHVSVAATLPALTWIAAACWPAGSSSWQAVSCSWSSPSGGRPGSRPLQAADPASPASTVSPSAAPPMMSSGRWAPA
jgi:hypothetical protein